MDPVIFIYICVSDEYFSDLIRNRAVLHFILIDVGFIALLSDS